ncbi:MAG: zinc metallopeptidase [Clostridia bacterium]|nr:zinc metallopeptidase [Clostridia bacterium]
MRYGYYGIDIYYLLLVLPAVILSIIAQIRVKSVYKKMSGRMSSRRITGAQAATVVLRHYGIADVRVERVGGKLTDHFDPKSGVIRLSEGVFDSCSVAAVGIAAHEAGHAAQHAEGYAPIRIRNSLVPVCNIASWVGIPLAIAGYYLSVEPLIYVGLALYSLIMIFHLVTLPTELNASRRALTVIQEEGLVGEGEEYKDAKSMLTAAAMTYVAALATSLASLLRLLLLFTGRRRR